MWTRYEVALSALLGLGLTTLSFADMAKTSTTENTTVTSTQQESTQVQKPAEMKWTELKGKVQHIDLNSNVVQIKEKGTDKLIEVPVDNTVSVMDSTNHVIALGDLKAGQKVIIRHNPQS